MAANASSGANSADGPRLQASWGLVAFVVALFFFWGGITSLNDILIPKLKDLFSLNYTQAMLIQFAFFTAYALVSLPAGNLVSRLGYGRGIVVGLAVMAAGCLLFIPAAATAQYALFLGALFILAGGVTILQVAANPLMARLGDEASSHSRLTLAQAFNSLGTTIWPLVGAQVILGSMTTVDATTLDPVALAAHRAQEANVVSMSYLVIALMLAALALPFWFQRNRLGASGQAEGEADRGFGFGLLRRPRLGLGVLSIFLYVGAEVAIGSIIVNFLMRADVLALDHKSAGSMVALYWGGAMVGRFVGAGLLSIFRAGHVLAVAAIGAIGLALFASLSGGAMGAYALLAIGLMNSIMFPTIFSLALEGLDPKETAKGSGLLCMGIVGGAIIPLATGALADAASLTLALLLPAACYAGISLYGFFTARRSPVQAD